MDNTLTSKVATEQYTAILESLDDGLMPTYNYNGARNEIMKDGKIIHFTATLFCVTVAHTGYTTNTPELITSMNAANKSYRRNKNLYEAALKTIKEQQSDKKLYERIKIDGKRRYVKFAV